MFLCSVFFTIWRRKIKNKKNLKIVFPHKSFYCIKRRKRYLLKNDMIKNPDFEDSGSLILILPTIVF